MRRDKRWWARLTEGERIRLVYLERCNASSGWGHGGWLPDDCYECPSCSQPALSGGLCNQCDAELLRLIAKGNGEKPKEA